MTQADPSYLSYMFGLSANPHIHLKYGEDMRASGHVWARPVNPPHRTRTHSDYFFLIHSFLSLFISINHVQVTGHMRSMTTRTDK